MNEVITKLYEIEETAGDILENAKRYKGELQRQMEMEQIAFSKEMEHDLAIKLEKTQNVLDRQTKEQILQLEINHQKQIEKIDEIYDGHLNELAKDIFQRIAEV